MGVAPADGLTVRDICDVVYAIVVTSLEREVANAQLAAALVNAMGGTAEVPALIDAQREFDEWLVSKPEQINTAENDWRQVMGLEA